MAEQENRKDDEPRSDPNAGVVLQILWSELGQAVFADQVVALTSENMLHLGFYQTVLPIVPGETAEERKQSAEALLGRRFVDAKAVAHVVIPLSKLASIIDILTKQAAKSGLPLESK